jgi:hypothetical protein
LVAGLIGTLIAACFVLVRDELNNTIKFSDEITHSFKLPILGTIYKYNNKDNLITLTKPHSPPSDTFRSLRNNMQHVDVDYPIRLYGQVNLSWQDAIRNIITKTHYEWITPFLIGSMKGENYWICTIA